MKTLLIRSKQTQVKDELFVCGHPLSVQPGSGVFPAPDPFGSSGPAHQRSHLATAIQALTAVQAYQIAKPAGRI